MIWGLWVCAYMINNGLVTWLPTLYRQVFQLPLQTSLAYGWITSGVGVDRLDRLRPVDRQGRPQALVCDRVPARDACRSSCLSWLGATSAIEVLILATATYAILQTIAFSLYLYSAELYPTRLRAVGTGFGSAWLRAGSSIGPILVGCDRGGPGHPLCVRGIRGGRAGRRARHAAVRDRDEGQGS